MTQRPGFLLACVPASAFLAGCPDQTIGSYNTAPSAIIEAPDDQAHVTWGDEITFRGTVADAEDALDALQVGWSSSLDGELSLDPASADGSSIFSTTVLSPGQHTVTLRVSDSGGLVDNPSVTLFVDAPNQAPTAYVTSPANGEVFYDEEAVLLSGQVTDAEDPPADLTYEWTSDLDGQLAIGHPDSSGHVTVNTGSLGVGTHLLTLRAIDTLSATGEAQVAITVRTANQPPELSILHPANNDSFRAGEDILFELQAVDPDGDTPSVELELYDSGVLLTAGQHPDSSGYAAWATDDLAEGEHTVTVYAVDAEGAYTTRVVQLEVRPPNSCPTAPVVWISPASPTTADDLQAELAAESTDADGDAIDYDYAWYRNGVLDDSYALLVPDAATDRLETWRVEVVASDGDCESAVANDEVLIANSVPSVAGVALTPSPITEASGATCAPSGWADADGDAPSYTYRWTVDGVTVGATGSVLAGAYYARGDVLSCTVTPFDGYDMGPSVSSLSAVVANTAPGATAVAILPESPNEAADLTLQVLSPATDADGDALTYRTSWTRNGVVEPGLDGDSVVPASYTNTGEVWAVAVRAWDGSDEGPEANATVTVGAAPGLVWINEILYDSLGVSDADGEWIELFNPTASTVDLTGWVLRDDGGDSHVIAGPALVPAHGFLVMGRNGDPEANGGALVGYVYSGFSLDNTADEVILEQGGSMVDEVAYDEASFPAVTGASLSLDVASGDDTSNDDGLSWCPGRDPLDSGDLASPGAANDSCACYYTDLDGDGFTACDPVDPDCDDTDEDIHPGAPEACNAEDDDCDGLADDGLDLDGDGYAACGETPDCDETDPAVHPGALEVCDTLDNDCDGLVNDGAGDAYEGEAFTYYGPVPNGSTASFSLTIHEPSDVDRIRWSATDTGAGSWLVVQVTGIPTGQDYDLEVRRMADATSETSLGTVGASFQPGNLAEAVTVPQDGFTDQSGYYEARITNPGGGSSCSSFTVNVIVN